MKYRYYLIPLLYLSITNITISNAADYGYGNNSWGADYSNPWSNNYGSNYQQDSSGSGRGAPPWGGVPYGNAAPMGQNHHYSQQPQYRDPNNNNYEPSDYYGNSYNYPTPVPRYTSPHDGYNNRSADSYNWRNNSNANYGNNYDNQSPPPSNRFGYRDNGSYPNYNQGYHNSNQNLPPVDNNWNNYQGYQQNNDWSWRMNQNYGFNNRPNNLPPAGENRNFDGPANNNYQNGSIYSNSQYNGNINNNDDYQNRQQQSVENRNTAINSNSTAWDVPTTEPATGLIPSPSTTTPQSSTTGEEKTNSPSDNSTK